MNSCCDLNAMAEDPSTVVKYYKNQSGQIIALATPENVKQSMDNFEPSTEDAYKAQNKAILEKFQQTKV